MYLTKQGLLRWSFPHLLPLLIDWLVLEIITAPLKSILILLRKRSHGTVAPWMENRSSLHWQGETWHPGVKGLSWFWLPIWVLRGTEVPDSFCTSLEAGRALWKPHSNQPSLLWKVSCWILVWKLSGWQVMVEKFCHQWGRSSSSKLIFSLHQWVRCTITSLISGRVSSSLVCLVPYS